MRSEDLFFVDPLANLAVSYDQLGRDVAACPDLPLLFQPSSFYETFVAVLRTLHRNSHIAILPQGISTAEKQRIEHELNEKKELLPNVRTGQNSPPRKLDEERQADPLWIADVAASQALIGIFTSGSTGRPKLVWHRVDSLTRAVRRSRQHAQNVWGLAYHPAHFAGLQVFFQAVLNGNPLIRLLGLSEAQVHATIDQYAVTHISATPTFFRLFATADAPPHAGVVRVTAGGEPLTPRQVEGIARVFPLAKLTNIYASTEAGTLLTAHGEYFSVPPALQGLVKAIDGELAVHRSLLAASLQDSYSHQVSESDFWFTGDLVEPQTGQTGCFRILSRREDRINVGGYKVDPLEVEELLLSMEEVADARVFGKSNSITGSLVCCDLVLRPGCRLTAKEILIRLTPKVAAYKIPRIVNTVQRIPTTVSGKQARA